MCLHKVWSHVIIELSLWSLISVQKFSSPSSWYWKKRDASENSLHSGNFSLGWWIVLNHLNFQSTFQFLFSWQIWFKILSQIFVYIFASLAYAFHSLIKLIKLTLWISKEHNNFNCLCKFEADIPNNFEEINFEKLETLQRIYGLIFVLQPSNFEVSTTGIPFVIACKKLKIAQQLLTFICAYSDAFYGLKNVNSDVSEDLLIATNFWLH